VPLLIVLALLAGCAPVGSDVPLLTAMLSSPGKGPPVTRYEEGQTGFVITENAHVDSASRHDFEQAVVALQNADYRQAIELLEQVVATSPGVSAPYINLAIAYAKIGQPEQAETQLKTALDLYPGHPVASNEYGLLLRKNGRFNEARTLYEQALVQFPEYLPARKNLGILCDLYLNDQECALAQFETYAESVPGDEQVKLWVAELRLRLGR
jgi:Flp pilus assembly protein TadD